MSNIARLTESSPTASLLRNSRLFSVPQPLPRPSMVDMRGRLMKRSDNATTYYPTHQVIATPESSRVRGDWGLKRSIPKKSSRATKAIRVDRLDTYEEITEFESALDHAKTLEKLQELNLSITRLPRGKWASYGWERYNRQPSAFEPEFDNTAKFEQTIENSREEKEDGKLLKRWKLRGPELRQTNDVEFEQYLSSEVDGKIQEFAYYLKTYYVKRAAKSQLQLLVGFEDTSIKHQYYRWICDASFKDIESYLTQNAPQWMGAPVGLEPQDSDLSTSVDSSIFEQYLIKSELINKVALDTEGLVTQVSDAEEDSAVASADGGYTPRQSELLAFWRNDVHRKFLDSLLKQWPEYLSRYRNTSGTDPDHRHMLEYFFDLPQVIPASILDAAQLSTHPSAGLSYRRSGQILNNHPQFGPQRIRQPHRARLLPSANSGMSGRSENEVGLAGLMVKNRGASPFDHSLRLTDEKSVRGTPKAWVVPSSSHITPTGRIQIDIFNPNQASVMVAENQLAREVQKAEEEKKIVSEGFKEDFPELESLATKAQTTEGEAPLSS